jgi:hypothetical protein
MIGQMGKGIYRDPSISYPASDNYLLLQAYEEIVLAYSSRRLTKDEDCLNACNALVQSLKFTKDKQGLFWGLPTAYLPAVLLWFHRAEAQPRELMPSWTWVGWEGQVERVYPPNFFAYSYDIDHTAPLRCWKRESGHLSLIYHQDVHENSMFNIGSPHVELAAFDISHYPGPETHGLLFVEALVGRLAYEVDPSIDISTVEVTDCPTQTITGISVRGISCLLLCSSQYVADQALKRKEKNLRFVVIMYHCKALELILLDWDDDTKIFQSSPNDQAPPVKRLGQAVLRLRQAPDKKGRTPIGPVEKPVMQELFRSLSVRKTRFAFG